MRDFLLEMVSLTRKCLLTSISLEYESIVPEKFAILDVLVSGIPMKVVASTQEM